MEPADPSARPRLSARAASALSTTAWIVAALTWVVASGATLRYLHTEASIVSIVWILIAVVCAVLAVVVDVLTRRVRGTGPGAVTLRALGSAVTGLSLGFAIADAVMVSRGYAEPKGYLLAMAALVPTLLGLLIFFAPGMRERSRRARHERGGQQER
ncbi:hypothetical protein [Microbacterium sp. MYb64]|uniref:hypothetical protein n=1 Tax=Microbacterium sp. MYb64 TaxID=1848691 RepID=UPI000CFC8848|nr:hypothetical protein [Microbacterium sp. MYb64]PRB03666.1 hypothetical protein CQ044_12915 [Microbacterium sp. MYb64]